MPPGLFAEGLVSPRATALASRAIVGAGRILEFA
jgi:hypothetical protein